MCIRDREQQEEQEDKWIIRYLNGGEDILSYHQIINLINRSGEDGEPAWTFQNITGHRRDKKKKWIVEILWDTNEKTWEPIENIKATDPITLANYAKTNKLLGIKGWKWAKDYVDNGRTINLLKKILRVNKKKAKSGSIYQFGVAVPRSTKQAYQFDQQNGNTA